MQKIDMPKLMNMDSCYFYLKTMLKNDYEFSINFLLNTLTN